MWWWIGKPTTAAGQSEADRLRTRKKQLAKDIATKKLAIKRLKRALKAKREERFKERVAAMPALVDQIIIDGLGRTRDEVVRGKVVELFKVQNFQDIIWITKRVHKDLKELGCFSKVNIMVDTANNTINNKNPINGSDSIDTDLSKSRPAYQVRIQVEEIGPFFLNVGAVAGPQVNEVSGVLRGGLNNLLGGAERLEAEISRSGIGCSSQQLLRLTRPLRQLPAGSSLALSLGCMRSPVAYMPLKQELQSLSLSSILAYSQAVQLTTRLGLDYVTTAADWQKLRSCSTQTQLHNLSRWHPGLADTGSCLLPSLSNTLSIKLLDSPLLPAHGLRLLAGHLTALRPGTARLAFQQVWVSGSAYYPLNSKISLGAGCLAHLTQSYDTRPPPHLQNQYRHPLVTRGARTADDYRGDMVLLAYCLSLTSKLPFLGFNTIISQHIRLHAFLTGYLSRTEGFCGLSELDWLNMSHICGIGILGRIADLGRWELNYCWPYQGRFPTKGGGLSFGFSSSFL